jgi:O-succinylbenzoate synthase
VKIDTFAYELPFERSVRGVALRKGWRVRMTAYDGIVGWGEAACWPGFGSDEATVERALRGEDEAPEVDHAYDVAELDIEAQRLGLSIAKMLHPEAVDRVPTHVRVHDAASARAAVDSGARALKIKIDALTRAALPAIRAAVDVPLRFDCNGDDTYVAGLEAFEPEWIEQPMAPGAPLPRLRAPIAVDESITGAEAVRVALDAGAAVIVLKPMFLGGLRPTRALARLVWQAGARVCITHALGSAIDRIAARHLAAALIAERPDTACGLAGQLRGDFVRLPALDDGHLALPAGPGLGILQ